MQREHTDTERFINQKDKLPVAHVQQYIGTEVLCP